MKKIILLVALFIFYVSISYSQSGTLDSSFGNNGIANVDIESNGQVLVQNDQAIYVILHHNDQTLITHLLADGTVDSSYGNNGISVSVPFGGLQGAIQGDGKIVVAGGSHFFRFNTDGSLDETFSPQPLIGIMSVAIQQDGKIVVAGSKESDFAVARYNINGTPDLTFSEDGQQTTDFGNFDLARSVAIQSDGKIVVAGYTQNEDHTFSDFAIARYNIDGTADITFSGDGKQTTDFTANLDYAMSVAIQSDGKIVATGIIYSSSIFGPFNLTFAIARYNTDGSLDNTFSEDGKQTTGFQIDPDDSPVQMHGSIQSDGKIVVTGFYAIARYNTGGSLDATFSQDGKQTVEFEISSSAIQSEGKLIVAGEAIARYLLDDESQTPPTVNLITPAHDTTYTAYGYTKIILNAVASDVDGTISKVEFYNGTTLLHTEYVASYGFIWHHVAAGNYTITTKATDNDGNVTTSDAVHISVKPDIAPTVNITSPSNGASYRAYSNIILSADANDVDGTVKKVDFYNGSTLIFTEYVTPFKRGGYRLPLGNYLITAKATDNNGRATTSQPVAISVLSDVAPVVSITSPANHTTYVAPATIILSADASDVDGTIKKADFYNGSTLLFTENDAPYFRSWPDVPKGNYSITAIATDNEGKVTTSAPIAISVISAARSLVKEDKLNSSKEPPGLSLNPNPVAGTLNISLHGLQPNGRSAISVLSVSGAVIKTIQPGALNKSVQLDVSLLSGGVYFIKVINGDKILYKQFVKL